MAHRIVSLEELKELAARDCGVEVFTLLLDGIRMVKRLWFFPALLSEEELWDIYYEANDTFEQNVHTSVLQHSTMIIEAISSGDLYQYD